MGTIGYQDPETDKVPIPELYEKRQHYHMFKVKLIRYQKHVNVSGIIIMILIINIQVLFIISGLI